MGSGAHTPEELEVLFEDAFITRDRAALAELFEDGAVFAAGDGVHARGGREIARIATTMWNCDTTYIADPRRVFQARDTGLVVAEQSINVVRRAGDGVWRFAISFLVSDHTTQRSSDDPEAT